MGLLRICLFLHMSQGRAVQVLHMHPRKILYFPVFYAVLFQIGIKPRFHQPVDFINEATAYPTPKGSSDSSSDFNSFPSSAPAIIINSDLSPHSAADSQIRRSKFMKGKKIAVHCFRNLFGCQTPALFANPYAAAGVCETGHRLPQKCYDQVCQQICYDFPERYWSRWSF